MLNKSKFGFGVFLYLFILKILYYYQVHESEFRYPIFHVLDNQILRINRPQSTYLSRDTFSYNTVSVMFLFYYLQTLGCLNCFLYLQMMNQSASFFMFLLTMKDKTNRQNTLE